MRTVIIVAMNSDRLIGAAGRLPWRLPADLKHFKATTLNHAVVMGRRTYESCAKPLPRRRNIVVSRSAAFAAAHAADAPSATSADQSTTLDIVSSLDDALALCRRLGEEDCYIAGGAQIYEAALPLADEMIVTWIDAPDAKGDTYFPAFDESQWRTEPYPADPALKIVRYIRRK
jgi:dihydrofolate reductase